MWTRVMIKDRAKAVLQGNYWKAFLVALILMFVGGINLSGPFDGSGSGGGSNSQNHVNNLNATDIYTAPTTTDVIANYDDSGFDFDLRPNFTFFEYSDGSFHFKGLPNTNNPALLGGVITFFLLGMILFTIAVAVVWRVFLGYPVEIGCTRFFLNLREDRHNYRDMVQYFNRDQYWNIVKTMFMRGLFNTLWYMLLIIPGIVKAYAYSMVPYILADDPELDYDTAIQKSMHMTEGHKLDMFVLDLSFIGWYLLGLLLCCVGGVFVNPYYLATKAELYTILSGKSDLQPLEEY